MHNLSVGKVYWLRRSIGIHALTVNFKYTTNRLQYLCLLCCCTQYNKQISRLGLKLLLFRDISAILFYCFSTHFFAKLIFESRWDTKVIKKLLVLLKIWRQFLFINRPLVSLEKFIDNHSLCVKMANLFWQHSDRRTSLHAPIRYCSCSMTQVRSCKSISLFLNTINQQYFL